MIRTRVQVAQMVVRTVGALFAALPAGALHAQGSSIHAHSGCMIARSTAGVAEPCADGSAVFYNPAALAVQGGAASLGLSTLYSTSTFTFDGGGDSFESQQGTVVAPHAWLQVRPTGRIGVGVGLW